MATLSTTKVAYHGGVADSGNAYVGTSYNGNSQEICTTRFKFTTTSSGATKITFTTSKAFCSVTNPSDPNISYGGLALIRFAITTDSALYKTHKGNDGYGYPANLSYDGTGDGYIKGSLNINLLPNTVYYLWVFPGSQYPGWTRHNLESCTVKTTGTYGTASTISASNGTFGSAVAITLSNPIAGVTNSISASVAGHDAPAAEIVKTDDDHFTWTPAVSEYAPHITDSDHATATITCTTLVSGVTKTSTSTIELAFDPEDASLVPVPSISVAANNAAIANTSITTFVQNYSKADATVVSGCKYSADPVSYTVIITDSNSTVVSTVTDDESPLTSGALTAYGTLTATVAVTDSRGYVGTASTTFAVNQYIPPSFTNEDVFRCNSSGVKAEDGTYLSIYATTNIAPLSSQNGIETFTYELKAAGGSFDPPVSLIGATLPKYDIALNSVDTTYVVRLYLEDKIGQYDEKTFTVPGQNWAIKFSRSVNTITACGIGKAPESASVLEIPDTWSVKRGAARALFSDDFIDLIYPVGSIYMSTASTDPGTIFGGTWQRIEDTFLLAAGTNHAAGTTGGAETVTLTVNEMPSHTHSVKHYSTSQSAADAATSFDLSSQKNTTNANASYGPLPTGGDQPHNNMPPYLAVYVWKRTA